MHDQHAIISDAVSGQLRRVNRTNRRSDSGAVRHRSTRPSCGRAIGRASGSAACAGRPCWRLVVRRREPGEFTKNTVDLLQTFAAQSVLAIQNARLFSEIGEKSRSSKSRASTSRNSSPT